MHLLSTIQWKAFLLLAIFAANFFVVCHCAANATIHKHVRVPAHHHSCDKPAPTAKATAHSPCEEKGGCPARQAVKFNLLEKQVATAVYSGPLVTAPVAHHFLVPVSIDLVISMRVNQDHYFYKHSPPDLQALYHRFLI